MVAQIQLEQAILESRRAELELRSGAKPSSVRAMKNAAIQAITISLGQIAESGAGKFHEYRIIAEYWKKRLKT